jgi:hypothetical protein
VSSRPERPGKNASRQGLGYSLRAASKEELMITAIVRFQLPKSTSLADAKALFEKSAPNYRSAPGLIRKYYLFGEDRIGGGVYLWESREAADKQYSAAWKAMIADRYGAQPEITYYDTPVIVDNASG